MDEAALIAIAAGLLGVTLCARPLARGLARRSLTTRWWRWACRVATWDLVAVAALVVAVIVVLAPAWKDDTVMTEVVVSSILGLFVVNLIWEQMTRGDARYWKRIEGTLDSVLPGDPEKHAGRATFNTEHFRLTEGDRDERRDALTAIVTIAGVSDTSPTPTAGNEPA